MVYSLNRHVTCTTIVPGSALTLIGYLPGNFGIYSAGYRDHIACFTHPFGLLMHTNGKDVISSFSFFARGGKIIETILRLMPSCWRALTVHVVEVETALCNYVLLGIYFGRRCW